MMDTKDKQKYLFGTVEDCPIIIMKDDIWLVFQDYAYTDPLYCTLYTIQNDEYRIFSSYNPLGNYIQLK